MLPASRFGAIRTLARACHCRLDVLDLRRLQVERVIQRQWTVQYAAGDLSPVSQLAQRSRLDCRGNLRIDRLHRAEDGNAYFPGPESVREIDRILHDIDLLLERGRNVYAASARMIASG
jgi:hypothetical protein